jgi:hypothetical protein
MFLYITTNDSGEILSSSYEFPLDAKNVLRVYDDRRNLFQVGEVLKYYKAPTPPQSDSWWDGAGWYITHTFWEGVGDTLKVNGPVL